MKECGASANSGDFSTIRGLVKQASSQLDASGWHQSYNAREKEMHLAHRGRRDAGRAALQQMKSREERAISRVEGEASLQAKKIRGRSNTGQHIDGINHHNTITPHYQSVTKTGISSILNGGGRHRLYPHCPSIHRESRSMEEAACGVEIYIIRDYKTREIDEENKRA
ncbi:hypothetical protein LTR70_009089 [Exophiala xenobiotica]|uniref:Uncharacterized protein n=1 Tax=Lithohypha guttulata TaxID=1690604 RepID=A0ABR0JVD1_9EURO|nr:hypothetical protein LTR24_009959 [Lithohypha guttulata]KAK5311009.1 hypothetical protein LTR70_009089 [Exophiala xenobiotica]